MGQINVEPYVGPRPFTPMETELFFGRDDEAKRLVSLIIAHPVVLLYAQSGAGKTSLLNARIIPWLDDHNSKVIGSARVNGQIPEGIDRNKIKNIYLFNALMSMNETGDNPNSLVDLSFAKYLKSLPPSSTADGLSSRRVIIFDQFEELFTTSGDRWIDREKFFDGVGDALDEVPNLRVVFAMREEYIANMDPFAGVLPERLRTRYRLERLRESAALEAATKPLEGSGRTFAPGAAEKLVQNLLQVPIKSATGTIDISGEFVEPVQLQVVCQKLWRSLPTGVTVIDEGYIKDFGDVDDALSTYYEDCLKKVVEEKQIKEGSLRRWFSEELITSEGTRGTIYHDEDKGTTGRLRNDVVEMLEDLRLVRPEMRGGTPWYELTHDRFISPILQSNKRWFGKKGQAWDKFNSLKAKATKWQTDGGPQSALLFGLELIDAQEWSTTPEAEDIGLTGTIREYLQASKAAAAQRQAGGLRRQRIAFGLISLIAVAAALYAIRAKGQAQIATLIERGMIAKTLAGQPGKEFDALALGIRAVGPSLRGKANPTYEALDGLREASKRVGDAVWFRGINGSDYKMLDVLPDWTRILFGNRTDYAIWQADTGKLLFKGTLPTDSEVVGAYLIPGSNQVLALTSYHQKDKERDRVIYKIQYLDPDNQHEPETVFDSEKRIQSFAPSQGRTHIAFWDLESTYVLDLQSRKKYRFPSTIPPSVSISLSGTKIVTIKSGKIELWSLPEMSLIKTLGRADHNRNYLLFSPDESKVMVFGYAGEFSVIDLKTNNTIRKGAISRPNLWSIKFSADSNSLVFLTRDSFESPYLWSTGSIDINSGLESTNKSIQSTSLSAVWTNKRIAAKSKDRLTIFDQRTTEPIFSIDSDIVDPLRLSPDDLYLLTKYADALQMWDIRKTKTDIDKLSPQDLLKHACQQVRYQDESKGQDVKTICHDFLGVW